MKNEQRFYPRRRSRTARTILHTYGLYFREQHVDKNEQKKVALEISSATFC